jgi:hypothetical protein
VLIGITHQSDALEFFAAAINENKKVTPALIRNGRRDKRHDSFGMKLFIRHDPHAHIVAPHHRQQHRIETCLEPTLAQGYLSANGKEFWQRCDAEFFLRLRGRR